MAVGADTRSRRRWCVCVCGAVHWNLLQAVVCFTETAARAGGVFLAAGGGGAAWIPRVSAVPAAPGTFARPAHGCGGDSMPGNRGADRCGWRKDCERGCKRDPFDAAHAELSSWNERASTGTRVSQRDGNFSAAVYGCATDAPVEVPIAKRRRRSHCAIRRRIWIEQPIIRARSGAIGDDACYLPAGRRGNEDPLHDCRFAAWPIAGGGDCARDQRAVFGERRRTAGKFAAQGISARRDPSRQQWAGRLATENTGALARKRTESGFADRRAGDCVSTA